MLISALVSIAILLLSVVLHELAHAYAADKLGDPTPRIDGRLTLNPLAHLEWFGSVILPLTLSFIGSPIVFGWAKPVVFDPYNLKNQRRDTAIISLAGPLANIAIAIVFSLIARIVPTDTIWSFLTLSIVQLNVTLAIFNLVPVHPLDGGKILVGLLPYRDSHRVDLFLRKYGTYILLLLILPIWQGGSPLFAIISPIIKTITSLLLPNYY